MFYVLPHHSTTVQYKTTQQHSTAQQYSTVQHNSQIYGSRCWIIKITYYSEKDSTQSLPNLWAQLQWDAEAQWAHRWWWRWRWKSDSLPTAGRLSNRRNRFQPVLMSACNGLIAWLWCCWHWHTLVYFLKMKYYLECNILHQSFGQKLDGVVGYLIPLQPNTAATLH